MIYKRPKKLSLWGKVVKTAKYVIIGEVALCAGAYYLYRRLNREPDFRYYMKQNHYWVLDAFYSIGEKFSSDYKARELDLSVWQEREAAVKKD